MIGKAFHSGRFSYIYGDYFNVMKKIVFLVCVAIAACSQPATRNFKIEGILSGVKDGTEISLYRYDGGVPVGVDTTAVVNGRFSFSCPVAALTRLSISGPFGDPEFPAMSREIWAEPGGRATVKGGDTLIFTWAVRSKVPEQKIADRYMLRSKDEYNRVQRLQIEENMARLAGETGYGAATAERKSIDSLKYLRDDVDMIINRNNIAVMDETPISEIWLEKLYALSSLVKRSDKYAVLKSDAVRLYERLSDEERQSNVAQAIHKNLFAAI